MKSLYVFILFIILAILQIAVPTQMIFDREGVLNSGTAYKFRTEPVDPSDPFKGKYIVLSYDVDQIKTEDKNWQRHQEVFITIENDSLGFAEPISVSIDQPQSGDYVTAKVDWYSNYDSSLHFSLPFNEFYMEESKAYDAEVAHRDAQRDSLPNNTYALVYVMKGNAVLDNVFINDIPIAEFVEQ
ncbi:GDYXXLXY domain-containing protein [uncultured Psychroserpens sp.]|uniref:GDYXXLXY domain-containing protein n=1 Tax=uncultured Psychroserpens sp. TaxID=255436 RepID=UPI002639BE54|nr:GDYXXLXY domain-containing protein [uncultured Psychroserpens sp.]